MGEQAKADRPSALHVETALDRPLVAAPLPPDDHASEPAASEFQPDPPRRRSTRRGVVRTGLVVADVVAVTISVAVGIALGGSLLAVILFVPAWAMLATSYGLYRRDHLGTDNATLDEVWPIFNCVTVAAWAVFIVGQLGLVATLHGRHAIALWATAVIMIPVCRSTVRSVLRRRKTLRHNTLVVGAGLVGQEIARKIMRQPAYGLELVGFVDADPMPLHHELSDMQVLGPPSQLGELLERHLIAHVVLAFTADHEAGLDVVRVCNEHGVQVDIVPRLFEVVGSRAAVYSLEGTPLLGLTPPVLSNAHRLAKRSMDVIGAVVGLVAMSPILAACAIAIKLEDGGPVLFRQARVGKRQRGFTIVKLRTMVVDAEARKQEVAHLNAHTERGDARMFKIPDDPRVTRVGSFLRRTSLDEFPQLWNVLRGEMSLVGPRPLIPQEHQFVNNWGLRRLDLTPGLTGLWQVCGRSEVTFSQMLVLDYLYVTNWSLWGDIKLILRTVPALMGHTRGAS
ncbi:MAG TPA: sugar transferase [Thermoleophilia bacterium]|nr:sugar transferase [Thermoleophilia bacterium]